MPLPNNRKSQTTQLSFVNALPCWWIASGTGDRIGRWNGGSEQGRLQGPACMEDIDFRAARGLDKQVVRSLINDSDWVRRHQHIFLVGPTGIGKTFLAKAFGQKACRDGFTAYFATAAQLFRGTGVSAGGRQLCQAATRAGAGGCTDR